MTCSQGFLGLTTFTFPAVGNNPGDPPGRGLLNILHQSADWRRQNGDEKEYPQRSAMENTGEWAEMSTRWTAGWKADFLQTITSLSEEKCFSQPLVWIPAVSFTHNVFANFSGHPGEMCH